MVHPDAVTALGAKHMAKVCELKPEQEAAAQAEIDEEKKQRLEQQQATGKFLLFLGLGFLYLLWLQDFVPPILDVIAQKLGFRRFIRVGELTGRGAGAPEPPDL
mmetsp:Transcript_12519/g.37571  ORF Transcript_12519/g.37571 Transcript_12519/m.37571 type:complete len:104 (-) Transcript_12519:49-360(-)